MKTLICSIFLAIFFASANSQINPLALRMDLVTRVTLYEKSYLQNGAGTLIVEVFPYTIYKAESSGQYYIDFTNSRLAEHRKYFGWAWGVHEYEGNTIFFNKDTTQAWIWTVDRYGQIFKMDLPDWFATDAKVIIKNIEPE